MTNESDEHQRLQNPYAYDGSIEAKKYTPPPLEPKGWRPSPHVRTHYGSPIKPAQRFPYNPPATIGEVITADTNYWSSFSERFDQDDGLKPELVLLFLFVIHVIATLLSLRSNGPTHPLSAGLYITLVLDGGMVLGTLLNATIDCSYVGTEGWFASIKWFRRKEECFHFRDFVRFEISPSMEGPDHYTVIHENGTAYPLHYRYPMDESLRKSISISWTKYYLRRVRERIQQNGFHDFLVGKNTTFRVFSDRVILRVDREEIVLQRGRGVIKMELKERIDDETIYDWEFMIEPSPDRENPLNFQFQLNETPNQVALFTILRRVLKIKSKTLGKNLLPEWHHGSW